MVKRRFGVRIGEVAVIGQADYQKEATRCREVFLHRVAEKILNEC
jgi:hypothetical protein